MKLTDFKWLLLILCCLAALPAMAEPLRFSGDYTFDWSGIRIGKLHLEIDQSEKDYRIESTVKTSGIAALFSDHKSLTRTSGKALKTKHLPHAYRADYNSNGKDKYVDLKYNAKGNVIAEDVQPSRGARPEVPEEMKIGAADSLTAVVRMREAVREALQNGEADIVVPVYDGVRRFDLLARVIDTTSSVEVDGETFSAIRLGLKRKPLGGFKDKEVKKIEKGEPELEFFLDKEHYTLLGFQVPLYGGVVHGRMRSRCVDEGCTQQLANAK